jgi:hypothetical protein
MSTPGGIVPGQVVEGERFQETLNLKVSRTEPAIASLQEDFGLCEADFLRLKNGDPKPLLWASAVFWAAVGLGLAVLGKYLDKLLTNPATKIENWEIYGTAVAFLVAALLYLIGQLLPNERKKVMKDIENHFSKAPRTRHIVR